MDKVTRIGVSLEPNLLDDFDGLIAEMGYGSRSEAIRDLIRDALNRKAWKFEEETAVGTVNLIYDHHVSNVKERLMDLQHEHHDIINASVHVHLNHDKCLEVLLVDGMVKELRELTDELSSLKGVLSGKLTLTSPITGHVHEHGLVVNR